MSGTAEQWAALKRPFPKDEIEKLPKFVGKKVDGKIPPSAYGLCQECGKRHPLPAIHLDYVGHAGITDRLNEVDPEWNWEPLSFDQYGLPMFSKDGLWIKLTVLGVTRYAFGDAQGKSGPNAVKEMIGDAIRNGAMRFGVGTYLWSKSEKAEHMREFDEQRAEEPKTVNPKVEAVEPMVDPSTEKAKRRMWAAIKKWSELHGRVPEEVLDGVMKRPSWTETAEFFESVALDFEGDMDA